MKTKIDSEKVLGFLESELMQDKKRICFLKYLKSVILEGSGPGMVV